MSRTLGVVTVARSDFGYYLPILQQARREKSLDVRLYVSGMHLSAEFGSTVRNVEAAGFEIAERIPIRLSSDSPGSIASAMAEGVSGFARVFARNPPDLLVVLGDRFDMYPAALAALPFKIPVVHLFGGERTEGAIDDSLRHSLTKLSHLHLVETREYARRVVQLGEEPWRVKVVGNPSLDNLRNMARLGAEELSRKLSYDVNRDFLVCTFHATTLEFEHAGLQADQLLRALHAARLPVLFTMPNADTGGRAIIERLRTYVASHPDSRLFDNLGTQVYFSVLARARAMVGNSSSGILEAASFRLPVVNVGNRQKGRVRPRNVLDVGYRTSEISAGLRRALNPAFRRSLQGLKNPFGDGRSAQRIVRALASVPFGDRLVVKRFHDVR